MKKITIYTDGACKVKSGLGGWGVLIVDDSGSKIELCGGEKNTTNNRMEMTAVIKALSELDHPHEITLYLDSQYVLKGITKWLANWKTNNWKTSLSKDVKNSDLWKQLETLTYQRGHLINWHWVRGHNGNFGNEKADELANKGAASL